MTVDVLIFKRWAPRSLRLDGRNLLRCDGAAYPFEQPAHYNSSDVFLGGAKCWGKYTFSQSKCIFNSKSNIWLVCPQASVTFSGSIDEILSRRAPWRRWADCDVSRGRVQHLSSGPHNKHPALWYLSSMAAPPNSTRNLQGGGMTWQTIISQPLDDYFAPLKTSLILKQIRCRKIHLQPEEKDGESQWKK